MVIPARDEADSIESTLAALAHQIDLVGRPLPHESYEIILLANNCRDETALVARRLAAAHYDLALHVVEIDLPSGEAHVGTARRLAMDEACRRLLLVGRPRGLIATTDADTVVSPTWLAATLRETDRGAEAVGGRILVAARERQAMSPSVRSRFLRNVGYGALANEVAARIDPRPGDPWPCHEQFSGASLALTACAYRDVGGLPTLPSGEDAALGHALRRADIEVRHSVKVRVQTSGRLDGRTPAGLAASLAAWSDLTADDQFQLVPSARTVVARAACRRFLRALWERVCASSELCVSDAAYLAEFAGVPETRLRHAFLHADRFGLFLDLVEEQAIWHRDPDLVDVRVAIADLRAWLESYRQHAACPPNFTRHDYELPFLLSTHRAKRSEAPSRPLLMLEAFKHVEAIGPLAPPPQVA